MNGTELPNESVMIALLDPATGHVVQVWYVASQTVIRIGRESDQDIVIADPYVSRQHAELRNSDGQWRLVALGRHGVIVNGERINETSAVNGLRFRLGTEGPTLRFSDRSPAVSNSATITADETVKIALQVNEARVAEEVNQIAHGDYFQQLQERARALRRRREEA